MTLAVAGWGARAAWVAAIGVVLFWRLGYPTFWDPDEAHYAESTREMLAAGDWFAPTFNGAPFFDKPFLFHALQMTSFALVGPTELAARLVPAASAVLLLAVIAWIGRRLFDATVGRAAALMFLVLPATFALTRYAILDMTFTLWLVGAAGCVTVAAVRHERWLQWPGYVLLGLAILTKGPLALVLTGLTFLVSLAIAPRLRQPLLQLRWGVGLALAVAIAAPWFVYMWVRFGEAFTAGYALRENIWLYARPLYGNQPSYFFYTRTMAVAMLPWTWLLVGRLVDAARSRQMDDCERVLWAWALVILGFFSFSRFKLDHYIFPAAPALCLLAARAWLDAQRAGAAPGIRWGARLVGLTYVVAGAAALLLLDRVPLTFPRSMAALPVVLLGGGLLSIAELVRSRGRAPRILIAPVATLVAAYAVVIAVGLPAFEAAKPVARLARLTAAHAGDGDRIAAFDLNRWSSSWRYYVGRPTTTLETPEEVRAFFGGNGRHYCAMSKASFEALRRSGLDLRIVGEEEGLFTTTGRNLKRGRAARRERFVVVTDATGIDGPPLGPPTI